MGSTTPKFAIPYPVGTDRVMDGDNAMQAIAERVEALLSARHQVGLVTVNLVGVQFTFSTVVFPTGFTKIPRVFVSSQAGDIFATALNVQTTGFDAGAYRPAGAITYAVPVMWLATDLY
jgi:hypothetical protein